jgi:hypothetical protein
MSVGFDRRDTNVRATTLIASNGPQSTLARTMHQNSHRWMLCFATLWWGWVATSCGPIDFEQTIGKPPYIDPDETTPAEEVVVIEQLGDGTVTLRANELYDPNDHDQLYGLWFGDERGLIDDVTLQSAGGTVVLNNNEDTEETFFTFEGTEQAIDPCEQIQANNFKETIWLFISDGDFADLTNPTPADDAYLVSHTWVLQYSTSLIDECQT